MRIERLSIICHLAAAAYGRDMSPSPILETEHCRKLQWVIGQLIELGSEDRLLRFCFTEIPLQHST
jgi:hypothetical protein